MLHAAFALTLALSSTPQDPPAADPDPVYQVEEIIVEGRRLDEAATLFVREVSAPVDGRGAARWEEGVCVGAANFSPEVGQYLVDRVSDVARELGLRGHEPPCEPSILIIGAADAAAMADEMVEMRPRLFIVGGSGMDQGRSALNEFRTGERPVRWWHVSLPLDADTGDVGVRLPGAAGATVNLVDGSVMSYAPIISRTTASRLREDLRDVLKRSVVIVDVDLTGEVSLAQLADYVAMVTLAQVDPEADTHRFESILNLFENPELAQGLSAWDLAYLRGLYAVQPGHVGRAAQSDALSEAILRAYRGVPAPDEEEGPAEENPGTP